jgi:hypothetical protein
MKSLMHNDKANVVLTVKMPNGETFTQEGKFMRVMKPLRTGGYRETFRMDVMRGKKWMRWIQNANSTEQLVKMAKRNGYQVNAA